METSSHYSTSPQQNGDVTNWEGSMRSDSSLPPFFLEPAYFVKQFACPYHGTIRLQVLLASDKVKKS